MPNLTIYLLREEFKEASDALVGGTACHSIVDGERVFGELFVKRRSRRSPNWADLFLPYVDKDALGYVQSTAAVYITKVKSRLFAITFGHGRFILNQEAFEERFGLLVTLNSVERDSLRSIDKHTFDTVNQNSRVQVSQKSAALDFGIDIEKDLIKGIVGHPRDDRLGRRLAGSDALTVTLDKDLKLENIRPLLRRYLERFLSTDYQNDFPWIDQIHQVRQKGARATRLNELLIQKLVVARANNGIVDGCWLTLPEVIDWSVVEGFKFTKGRKEGRSTDLHLPGFMHALKEDDVLNIELLRMRYAYAVDENDHEVLHWTVYKCLHCELDEGGVSYVLSGGHWFAIDSSFVSTVTNYFEHFPRYDKPLLEYNHQDEAHYNADLVDKSKGTLVLMDAKSLIVGGIYDKVEFCDVYSSDQELFHIKRYGSSNVLGHLFNQGLVSGELLKTLKDYVSLANDKLPHSHQIVDDEEPPRDVSGYKIVFCVISQSKKSLHIPFFARVAFKNVCTRLANIGYQQILVAKIECHDDVLVKKLKS